MAGAIPDVFSVEWGTPQVLVDPITEVLGGIDLDPCSNKDSIVGAAYEYRLPSYDGLSFSWSIAPDGKTIRTVFVNPPYGRTHMHKANKTILPPKEWKNLDKAQRKEYRTTTIADWLKRCTDYWLSDSLEIIALIPAATDTAHWQENIFKNARAACFIDGRVCYRLPGRKPVPAPHASALVYWGDFPGTFIQTTEGRVGRTIIL